MADSVTTNADLQAFEVMPDIEISRLSTARLMSESPPWSTRHELAWSETLDRLKLRSPQITEDDITVGNSVKLAVCYHVAYLAYRWAPGGDDDLKRAQFWFAQWERKLEEIDLSDTIGPDLSASRRWYRA